MKAIDKHLERLKPSRKITAPVVSAAGSVIIVLSFPPFNLGGLAFFGFVPIFWAVFFTDRLTSLFSAFVSGIIFYCFLFSWLRSFHNLSIVISAVIGILYFSAPLIISKLIMRENLKWGIILVPALWVLFEYVKTVDLLKFGFGIIGYSQFRFTSFIQIAAVCGVWGCSFLIILANYAIFYVFVLIFHPEKKVSKSDFVILCFTVFVFIAVLGYGKNILNSKTERTDFIVQLSQFNHGANRDWRRYRDQYLDEYQAMVELGTDYKPDLVIFPENSIKQWISLDPSNTDAESIEIMNRVSSMAKEAGTSVLLGVLELDVKEDRKYNSAFVFNTEGDLVLRYRKNLLAPFGEDDPFRGRIQFFERILARDTDIIRLDRGSGRELGSITGQVEDEWNFGTLICFEGTDGKFAAGYSGMGADFLINITSDAWSGSEGALEQHAAFAVFRAVENRKELFRVSNGGLTCVIDPFGVIVRKLPVFSEGILISELIVPEDNRKITFYSRYGDWFIMFCLFVVLAVAVKKILRKKMEYHMEVI